MLGGKHTWQSWVLCMETQFNQSLRRAQGTCSATALFESLLGEGSNEPDFGICCHAEHNKHAAQTH
jgi:hypothetical protein